MLIGFKRSFMSTPDRDYWFSTEQIEKDCRILIIQYGAISVPLMHDNNGYIK